MLFHYLRLTTCCCLYCWCQEHFSGLDMHKNRLLSSNAIIRLSIRRLGGFPVKLSGLYVPIVPESEEAEEWCKSEWCKSECVVETEIKSFKDQEIGICCYCCLGQHLSCNNQYSETSMMGQSKQHSRLALHEQADMCWKHTLTTNFQLDFLLLHVLGTVTVQVFPFFMDHCLSKSETKQSYVLFHCEISMNCFSGWSNPCKCSWWWTVVSGTYFCCE